MASPARAALCAATLLVVAAVLPAPARAQSPAYLRALTLPSSNAGQCVRSRQAPIPPAADSVERLELTLERVPGGRRRMTLLTGEGHRWVQYREVTSYSDSSGRSVVETVLAGRSPNGFIDGIAGRRDANSPAPLTRTPAPGDTAALRALRNRVARPLDAAERAKVGQMAAWVEYRCRASSAEATRRTR